jgi:hypothetical protein
MDVVGTPRRAESAMPRYERDPDGGGNDIQSALEAAGGQLGDFPPLVPQDLEREGRAGRIDRR